MATDHITQAVPMTEITQITDLAFSSYLKSLLWVSLAIHVLIILGVGSHWISAHRQASRQIEITLVPTQSQQKNKEADFLAQSHQEGGGESERRNAPTHIQPPVLMGNTGVELSSELALKSDRLEQDSKADPTLTTKNTALQKAAEKGAPKPDDAALIADPQEAALQTEQMNALVAKIANERRAFAKRPKKRFISASTEEFRDAAYLDQWRKKIEYIGNLRYPAQARRNNLSGEVLLAVALNAQGEVVSIEIQQTSGAKILDDAAIESVRLASPFDPFTPEMKKDTDILEIIRTWQFNGESLTTGARSDLTP